MKAKASIRKGKVSVRIYRAKTGKWGKPGIVWQMKNLLRKVVHKIKKEG